MPRKIAEPVETQLKAAVQDNRLDQDCLDRVLDYMCKSEIFIRHLENGPKIPEPFLGWWKDHTGGRTEWFNQELVPAIEKSGSLTGLRILDFGAGTGSSSVSFAERGAYVVGAEEEWISIRVALERAASLGLQQQCSFVRIPFLNVENRLRLPFSNCQFDVVTTIGVLEHMLRSELDYCSREIERVVKPGGRVVVFDTPNRWHPFDHHTTKLWFVGWLPVRLARWWAVQRGRIEAHEDFARRGGTGLSRHAIDRLFPPDHWEMIYEKPVRQVINEFEWLEKGVTFLRHRSRFAFGRAMRRIAGLLLPRLKKIGLRPALFAAMHTVIYRRREF
jgi:2-polyprenyl-3-methyl-5-hydroxy-6-metoxy-1,4-benzoquinol methylase